MTRVQRALLLVLGLASLAGIAVLWRAVGRADRVAEAPAPRPAPRASATSQPEAGGPVVQPMRRSDERLDDGSVGTLLEVIAVGQRGEPLPDVSIRVTGEKGETFESSGNLHWSEVTPGRWKVHLSHPGLLDYRTEAVVEDGHRTRVAAQLRAEIPLRGRVIDPFGRPIEQMAVWVLYPGEQHPATTAEAAQRIGSASNRAGEFSLSLPREGECRFSAGVMGDPQLVSQPFDLHLGGATQVEIVLGKGPLLEVVLEPEPGAAANDARGGVRLAVLRGYRDATSKAERQAERALEHRDDPGARRRRDANDPPRRRTKRGEAAAEGDGTGDVTEDERRELEELGYAGDGQDAPPQAQGGEVAPAPADDRPWREVASVILGPEGRVEIPGLPTGVDLRLVLLRKDDRLEADSTFVLVEGRRTTVSFRLPPRRGEAEIAAEPIGRFFPSVADQGPGRAGAKAGVTLR